MEKMVWAFGDAVRDGDVVKFNVGTRTYGDLWAEVDLADWWEVRKLRWRATKRTNLFYVRNSMDRQKLLHRILMDEPAGLVVDHMDGNGLNNCRSNLRVCTQNENNMFGADRRRGFVKRVTTEEVPTKRHVVKAKLADGTIKVYTYETRSKKRTKNVHSVKFSNAVKQAKQNTS